MMIRNKVKKAAGLVLTASMVFAMAGCGGGSDGHNIGSEGESGTTGSKEKNEGDKSADEGVSAMGRYVEEETDLADKLGSRPMDLCRRADGSLVIVSVAGFLVSKDQGRTWEEEMPDWLAGLSEEYSYIPNMYMAPDGTVAFTHSINYDDPDDYSQVLELILPDGTRVPVEMELDEDESYPKQVAVLDDGGDGVFFVSTYRSVYKVQRDGSYEKVVELDYNPQWIWVKDNMLFMDSGGWDEMELPSVYDMDAGEYIEDEVLWEFVAKNYKDRGYNGTDYADMYLLPGEDGAVYLAGKKGIHRHVIGGNMMEQIVDGNLSMLSNPSYAITDMMELEENVFLILFANSKLIRFTYDPDIPSVPENMMTVYSLREDENIRQVISLYQMEHPDVFVSYQVGMGEGDSVTREDAIKKLNTELMAGEGPDLLVMDDLPLDSYVDKGMLLDLTDYLAQYSAKEPLFDNVIEALKRGGKAYVAPATFGIPKIVAKAEGAENMTDLPHVAEVVEKLREEYPGEDIIGISGGKGILKRFAATSAPRWVTAEGVIDRDMIGEYLEQCKRILDAQLDGLDNEIKDYYDGWVVRMEELWGIPGDENDHPIYLEMMEYIGGMQQIMAGWTDSQYDYVQIASIDRTEGLENTKIMPIQGACSQVFKPQTMLGISAASGQAQEAKGFMDAFLSADVQSLYDGLPLNKKAFDIQFTPKEDYLGENGEYGSWSTSDGDGMVIEYTSYWPSDEQIASFKAELEALNTAYVPDKMLEKAVFDQGVIYMRGEQSLDEALDEIERAVAIYMAE